MSRRKRSQRDNTSLSRGAHARHDSSVSQPQVTVTNAYPNPNPRWAMPDTTAPMVKPKKRRGWTVVFWIALIVFIVCAVVIGVIVWSYWTANHRYENLAQTSGPAVMDTRNQTVNLSDLTVDWDSLRSINPDIVAWVYMPGTRINYPVCQTSDNQYYLDTDFNGNRNISTRSGTVFVDAGNNPGFVDQNNFMYGHHMNDGSMFACISTQLADNSEFNQHRTVYVLTPQQNYQCTSFAIVLTTGTDTLVQFNFNSPEEKAQYISDKEQRSVVTPSEDMPDPGSIQKLFTLSTCDYTQDNGRAVMFTELSAQAAPDGSHTGPQISSSDLAGLRDGTQNVPS